MTFINENYLKLSTHYLFPEIARRVQVYREKNHEAGIISLGLGDVTQPLVPSVVEAMKEAVEGMADKEGFHGYGPPQGYDFLANAIIEKDYNSRGVDLSREEIFISDGAKCDVTNIQEIFGLDNIVAVTDPWFPLYIDSNVMAGRTGESRENGHYDGVVYLPCLVENHFIPRLPNKKVDIIYLCFPNNPTGTVASMDDLKAWVDYAQKNRSIIIYDAAYVAYIQDPDITHSIYEIDGAKEVAIEIRSYSKTAGFTGIRCGFSVVPKQLKAYRKDRTSVQVNPIWYRRHTTKFNGASYISQVGASAIYTDAGNQQTRAVTQFYMSNAAFIRQELTRLGYTVYGGIHAPYIWLRTPGGLSSWQFFELLLERANVVGTPGVGFGPSGEGYFRLSTFATRENVEEAMRRLASM